MSYLIIKHHDDLEQMKDQRVIFIDCQFNQQVFEPLLDRYVNAKFTAYVRINNQYATCNIEDERKRISSGDASGLEHYSEVDFLKNQYNKYLAIQPMQQDEVGDQLNEFRKQKQRYYDLLLEKDKRIVIETYIEVNEQLERDIKLFHLTIDGSMLALTSNSDLYFTYCDELAKDDQLISKSNKKSAYKYFLLPRNEQYRPIPKVVTIHGFNYKQAFQLIRDKNFTVILNDQLQANQYLLNQCHDYQIATQFDLDLPQSKYIDQNRNILLYIKLVEKYGELEVYEFDGTKLHFKQKLEKNTYEYQKMLLNYKNDIYYNIGNE